MINKIVIAFLIMTFTSILFADSEKEKIEGFIQAHLDILDNSTKESSRIFAIQALEKYAQDNNVQKGDVLKALYWTWKNDKAKHTQAVKIKLVQTLGNLGDFSSLLAVLNNDKEDMPVKDEAIKALDKLAGEKNIDAPHIPIIAIVKSLIEKLGVEDLQAASVSALTSIGINNSLNERNKVVFELYGYLSKWKDDEDDRVKGGRAFAAIKVLLNIAQNKDVNLRDDGKELLETLVDQARASVNSLRMTSNDSKDLIKKIIFVDMGHREKNNIDFVLNYSEWPIPPDATNAIKKLKNLESSLAIVKTALTKVKLEKLSDAELDASTKNVTDAKAKLEKIKTNLVAITVSAYFRASDKEELEKIRNSLSNELGNIGAEILKIRAEANNRRVATLDNLETNSDLNKLNTKSLPILSKKIKKATLNAHVLYKAEDDQTKRNLLQKIDKILNFPRREIKINIAKVLIHIYSHFKDRQVARTALESLLYIRSGHKDVVEAFVKAARNYPEDYAIDYNIPFAAQVLGKLVYSGDELIEYYGRVINLSEVEDAIKEVTEKRHKANIDNLRKCEEVLVTRALVSNRNLIPYFIKFENENPYVIKALSKHKCKRATEVVLYKFVSAGTGGIEDDVVHVLLDLLRANSVEKTGDKFVLLSGTGFKKEVSVEKVKTELTTAMSGNKAAKHRVLEIAGILFSGDDAFLTDLRNLDK